MYRPIAVKALKKYRIWVKYEDDSEGVVDLSHLAGKPMFQCWEEADNFKNVYIDQYTGAIAWNEDVELCPDSIYFQINNLDPQAHFYSKKSANAEDQ